MSMHRTMHQNDKNLKSYEEQTLKFCDILMKLKVNLYSVFS